MVSLNPRPHEAITGRSQPTFEATALVTGATGRVLGSAAMEFRILGPFEVVEEGDALPLGGARQRALLAVLVLNVNRVVSADRLIDALWGESAPDGALHALQVYVSRLRKTFGDHAARSAEGLLTTEAGGYLLGVEADQVDLQRFERIAAEGRRALADGHPDPAGTLLRQAAALFRGPPLADFVFEAFAQPEIARIEDLRLTVIEDRVEADLSLGRHAELVGELQVLMTEHPLRERLRGQLMVAMYRSGRQAEALHVYRQGRAMLADELGIDPMPELQRLEQAILRQDPELDLAPRSARSTGTAPSVSGPSVSAPGEAELPRSERKFATALFADLVGSTALSEREDPEVVRSLVGRAFDRLAHEIERYGGTTEKFVGDAVLAVFGIPAAHEDDPERAVRAALDMQAALERLNRDLVDEAKPELAVRVGIEAGEVLVELDRVTGSRDRMLTGDAVNTAARLQSAAEPGQVVVGPVAYAAAKAAVEFGELQPLVLKGKAEPVMAWEALGMTAAPGGRPPPFGLRARLIGRDEEVALLVQTLHRVEAEARPALITILGAAGVGKSRLASELSGYVAGRSRPASWLKGRCLAYGNVSYSALAEAVKSECAVHEDDSPEVVSGKTAAKVEELFGAPDLTPLIEVLVGSGSELAFSREDLFDAWRRFLEKLASRGPLVIQLEDIHWADDGLLDFVDHVADWGSGPLLVLTLARPELLEIRPGWGGGKRNYSAIDLDPLTPQETETMLEDLLSVRLPDELARVIVERSEGNPLFAEEVVRMLIDQGVLRSGDERWEIAGIPGRIEVPASIKALIATRLDSLPTDEKATLQDAAVIGRTFWQGATSRLSGTSLQDTKEVLGRLRVKDVVVAHETPAFSGETELAFRHVLIRDVAYESLPKSLRADKHIDVAAWAEEQTGERREEIAELLATHYAAALRYRSELGERDLSELQQEVLRWSRAAGERALRLWQQREAVRWYRTALDLAVPQDLIVPAGTTTEELATLWESYATACEESEPYEEVTRALDAALDLYDQLGSDLDAGRVQARLAWVAFLSGKEQDVSTMAERALARLEPLGESRDLAMALHVLGWYLFRSLRFDEAERHLRRAIDVAGRLGDEVMRGHAMVSLAFVFQQTARGEECIEGFEEALEFARRAGDLKLRLRAQLHICGALEEISGDYRRGEDLVREGLELARRAGNVVNAAWMEQMLSDLLLDMGRLHEADQTARNALRAARAVGEVLVVGYALERIAFVHVLIDEPDEAEPYLRELAPIVRDNPEPWLQGWVPLIEGLAARCRGRDLEAARIFTEGARSLLERIMVWGGKGLLLECVCALVRLGRAEEARSFRDRLEKLARFSLPSRAFLVWADALLEPQPERGRALLIEAVDQMEAFEHRIEQGRCLIDLASAKRRLGEDPGPALERAREILTSCGATMFLREIDAAGSAPRP